jgi:ADP-ribose diphosphatase
MSSGSKGEMGPEKSRSDNPLPTIKRETRILSPWVTLETIAVRRSSGGASFDVFHAFRQPDYVHVLGMTRDGLFVLVQQYRPVIEQWTFELPGGLRASGEDAATTATRELREETGFEALTVVPLLECMADVGRLRNKFFGFFALLDRSADLGAPELRTVLVSGAELREHAMAGRIAAPSHIGLLYVAAVHPRVRELCLEAGHRAIPWLL